MGQEIERKLLLSALPIGLAAGEAIRQGYLSTGDPEVRVRAKGSKHFVTRKGGDGFVRQEEEAEITARVFEILWPATREARVEKTRYTLTGPDGLTWEIDEYAGRLAGLFTAEVELPTEETPTLIPGAIQAVLIRDVTTDKTYKNKALATRGLPASGTP